MTARIGWLSALTITAVCLQQVNGVPLETDEPPKEDLPLTIDEAMMKASGGRHPGSKIPSGRSLYSQWVEDGMDMVLSRKQYDRLYSGTRGRAEGHTIVAVPWTDGVIPYEISPNNFTEEQEQWIKRAMKHWEDVTCVRFRPATSQDKNRIMIRTGQGCWANLGMIGGTQIVNLDPYCFWKGTIEHELGHSIGLIHEHQRPQRDAYIRVNYYSVQSNFVDALRKYSKGSDDKLGLPYDYTSVMHYGVTAFSKDGYTQTLFTRDPTMADTIGMIMGPSFLDAKLVNLMYECSAKCSNKPTCGADCFVTEDCRCFCAKDMTKEVCEDHNAKCTQWKNEGECRGNTFYMHTFCRKSCGICHEDQSISRLPCINGEKSCEKWARNQQCEKSPGYMFRRCRLACGLCDPNDDLTPKGPCADKNSSCPALADNGACVRDPGHMLKDCTKSCDFCPEDVGDDPTNKPGTCTDYDGVCHYWADSNLCIRHYAWMSLNCRKACGVCDAHIRLPADCVDSDKSCHDWAFNGECDNNPRFMLKNCNQSCDHCEGLVKPNVGCVDFNLDCAKWAASYECYANPRFMEKTCPKSCKACPGDPPRPQAPCMDFSNGCAQWSTQGQCESNPIWMSNYCKKSCGKCTGNEPTLPPHTTPGACVDQNKDCAVWAKDHQCESNPSYMHAYCKKSCNVCNGGNVPNTNHGTCVDEESSCKGWAYYGECERNPGYMRVHCKKSCRVCTGSDVCVDESDQCQAWANSGHCVVNPSYMENYCKKSCDKCN